MPYKDGKLIPYGAVDTVKKSDLASNTTLRKFRPSTGRSPLTTFMSKHMGQTKRSNVQINDRIKSYMNTVRGK